MEEQTASLSNVDIGHMQLQSQMKNSLQSCKQLFDGAAVRFRLI